MQLSHKITTALGIVMSSSDALLFADEGWKQDSDNKSEMNFHQFATAIIALADAWTDEESG